MYDLITMQYKVRQCITNLPFATKVTDNLLTDNEKKTLLLHHTQLPLHSSSAKNCSVILFNINTIILMV